MKHFYFVKIALFLMLFQGMMSASLLSKSAIVYYGDDISYPLVGIHDYIIVDADHINEFTSGFKTYQDDIYAYVSINEIQKSRKFAKDIKPRWIIGKNSAWGSMLLNITDKEYQDFLLDRVIGKLYKRGFKNFFFDTLDSYQLADVTAKEKIYLRNGVIQFIRRFKHRYPKAKLIVNRGFEMIDYIAPYLEAVLFESYYYGFDASTKEYKKVSDSDRSWLDKRVQKVKEHHIPIIALDYIPSSDKKTREDDIKALQKRGFIPYISESDLMGYGVSSKSAVKRDILIIYNGDHLEDDTIASTNAHLFASTPIEYMGYIPVLKDINKPLPKHVKDRYAGVVIWLEKPALSQVDKLMRWVKEIVDSGVKVLFLGNSSLVLNHPITRELGIITSKNLAKKSSKNRVIKRSDMVGFEIEPSIGYYKEMIELESDNQPILIYSNSIGQRSILGAKMPWGGYVLSDALMSSFFGDNSMWIVDPFKMFRSLLELPTILVPDPTTENAKRLAFVHVDGDGSMNRVEHNPKLFSIEVIESDFIKKYKFPQSISLVESETAPYGKYPKLSPRLEAAAKKIYSYPYVEGATHTFTHPYFWKKLEADPTNEKYRTHWDINYTFTPKREISDSIKYVNQFIKDKKRKAHTVFWSGDCLPTANVVGYTYKHHITNINGGDTTITNDKPWLQLVQPFGLKLGDYYQVFTGEQNENVYTNDWLGPFWGFRKAIQTYKLTDKPRRFKPIDIYYHFYSASKDASHKALTEVYDWVLQQDVMHIFTSEYPPKVLNFYDASMANEGREWLIKGFDALRTIRSTKELGVPDMAKSIGVVGYKVEKARVYISLDEKRKKLISLRDVDDGKSRLVSANARVISHNVNRVHLKGYMPIKIHYKVASNCKIATKPKAKVVKKGRDRFITFKEAKDVYVTTECR